MFRIYMVGRNVKTLPFLQQLWYHIYFTKKGTNYHVINKQCGCMWEGNGISAWSCSWWGIHSLWVGYGPMVINLLVL